MRHLLPLLVLAGCLALPAAGSRAENKVPARVADLIAQLGSDRYAEREEAARALDAVGPAALPGLRAAAHGDDPEVSRRAAELVAAIERRQETDRLLQPKGVRLVLDNATVPEAIARLAKETGYPLQLRPEQVKGLTERRVTLDTGQTTYWGALARLCEAAGLREQGLHGELLPVALPGQREYLVQRLTLPPAGNRPAGSS